MNELNRVCRGIFWLFPLFLAACAGSISEGKTLAPSPPSATNRPTQIPAPTQTATASPTLLPTATPTATLNPTVTPEPTPEGDLLFEFDFIRRVLPLGESGAFDDFAVWAPDVIFYEGVFHMFYTAFDNRVYNNSTIGYATSPDGITWTKYAGNPILVGTEANPKLQAPAVLVENGQWVMYVDGGPNGGPLNQSVLRATASSPTGPWRLEEEPAFRGSVLNWDILNQPVTVEHIDSTYYLFYSGVGSPGPQMGVALSTDGKVWEPYNDPATNDSPFKYSDPILPIGPEGSWDQGGVASYEVMYTSGQWEMFYIGFPEDPFKRTNQQYEKPLQIGYATSPDAIHWEKYIANPAFSSGERIWPLLEAIRLPDGRYYLYYDLDGGTGGLALMEVTINPKPQGG